MCLLIISTISAELVITPNTLTINGKVGETQNFIFDLWNTFDYEISDFQFTNTAGFVWENLTIAPNETKTMHASITKLTSSFETINSEVSFKYKVDIPTQSQTHEVNITPSGFSPNYLIIRRGDSVKWNNIDSISRTATGSIFDYSISPNQSATFTFNLINEYFYQDINLFQTATIKVINESTDELINNPSNNKPLTINLEISLSPTTLENTLDEVGFIVDAVGSEDSLLTIENTGNETAQKVRLTSSNNWIKFDKDDFNIEVGKKSFITYSIEPIIITTNETDQNYSVDIIIKASNTEEYKKTINVFIPFNNNFDDINTNEGFFSFYTRYCQDKQHLLICNNSIQSSGDDGGTGDYTIQANLTAREVQEALRGKQGIIDSMQRNTNEMRRFIDEYSAKIDKSLFYSNQTLESEKNRIKDSDATTRMWWILFITTFICGSIAVSIVAVRKWRESKNLEEGGFNPNQF